ncbi:MAG: hypothetical protein Kow0069_38640 [Promethearchaeota archaeon]
MREYLRLVNMAERACHLLEEFCKVVAPEDRIVLERASEVITRKINELGQQSTKPRDWRR